MSSRTRAAGATIALLAGLGAGSVHATTAPDDTTGEPPPPGVSVIGDVEIPEGTGTGDVEVVLLGAPFEDIAVPFVVRNNTDEPLYGLRAESTARASDGTLVAAGRTLEVAPVVVPPGGYAFGDVAYPASLDGTETHDLQWSSNDDPGDEIQVDVVEAELTDDIAGPMYVGIARNTSDHDVTSALTVLAACFDDAGAITSISHAFAGHDGLAAGAEVGFNVGVSRAADGCTNALIAVSGRR
ncbi:hypothetical protein [Desertimonas flava]|uniref:hypothetical protein n=1 Tax=Desertimonas flava TaxID=2064846 RepID=UPI000E342DDF|nr:hypothetical protein [Desertimonas flava]